MRIGKLVTVSEAIVKVHVNGAAEPLWSVGEGNGPVNALDQALRKDLGKYQKHINDIELVDYKVRILTGGTEAVTRVLVETHDNQRVSGGSRSAFRPTSSMPVSRRCSTASITSYSATAPRRPEDRQGA